MKTYYLNIVYDGSDDIVAYYDSLIELRRKWANDVRDFLSDHDIKNDDDANWYPYFTTEDESGKIIELTFNDLGIAA